MEPHRGSPGADPWAAARADLDGLPNNRGLNIAYEAVDRHVTGVGENSVGENSAGDRVAIRWLPRHGPSTDMTYADLMVETNRFANALVALGHGRGGVVATLLGRVPELYISALGTLKLGGVFTPLFSSFGPEPIVARVEVGQVTVLITSALLYRRKVRAIRHRLPGLRHVLIVGGGASTFDDPSVIDLAGLMSAAGTEFEIPTTSPDDAALLHFTSGTTGQPKAAIHVHEAVVAHGYTGRLVLGLEQGTTFWCTADPGWVTGTSYGIIAPLVNGVTSIVDEADFDAERWYRIIQDEQVDVFYTAPTALRMLQRAGSELAASFDFGSLRMVASVGEPLDAELISWAVDVFGVPVLDTWWQTETGGIMIANLVSEHVKPGSMGRSIPGVTAGLLRIDSSGDLVLDADGQPVEVDDPDEIGELALEAGWPSMFRGYLGESERYRRTFAGRWYRSGDLARRDGDGSYWFVGRNDDLIKSAGHLIGPFEVESALNEHPAVLETGVIGTPDPTVGEIVKAFVVLVEGVEAGEELRTELNGHARQRLGAAIAPREIEFVDDLPHTRTGKIMRRHLKAREIALAIIIEVIGKVAPDVADELGSLDRSIDLWEELQLDSMDHLNIMTAISERTGVAIEASNYAKLRSLDAIAEHLALIPG